MPKLPIALQLYTVRDDAAKDFAGTLKKVAEIGYAGVELAGYHGMPVRDLKARLDDLHLFVAGSHIGIDQIEGNLAQVVEDNLALRNRYVVVPFLSEERRRNADGYKKTAETLNTLGQSLLTYGLSLAYHNHNFEFALLENGQRGEDILLENTDPMLVQAEVDSYWVLTAGVDPVAFIKKHSGRVPLLHLKDRDKDDGSFAPLGIGDLPLDALIAAAHEIGTEYLVVEQDSCKQPPLEAVKISYDCLKERGVA